MVEESKGKRSHYDAMECKRSNGGNLLLFMKNEQQQNPLKCRFIP